MQPLQSEFLEKYAIPVIQSAFFKAKGIRGLGSIRTQNDEVINYRVIGSIILYRSIIYAQKCPFILSFAGT